MLLGETVSTLLRCPIMKCVHFFSTDTKCFVGVLKWPLHFCMQAVMESPGSSDGARQKGKEKGDGVCSTWEASVGYMKNSRSSNSGCVSYFFIFLSLFPLFLILFTTPYFPKALKNGYFKVPISD